MNDTRSDVDPIEPAPLNLKNTDVDFSLAEELPDSADDLLREIEAIYREVTKLLAERKDKDPDYVKGATEALQPLLVDIVQAAQEVEEEGARNELWGSLWRELRWDPAGPELSGQVAMWGVVVVDGERTKSFLTEPRELSGEGPAETFEEVPENLFPDPVRWEPGDEYIQGSELVPDTDGKTRPLPPVVRFFRGDEWSPVDPGQVVSGVSPGINFTPNDNFFINGVVAADDGIYAPDPPPQLRSSPAAAHTADCRFAVRGEGAGRYGGHPDSVRRDRGGVHATSPGSGP